MSPSGDIAQQLLSCLESAYASVPESERPGEFCLRVGEVPFSIGTNEDLCCTGLAWVRIVRIYPANNDFTDRTEVSNCPPSMWGVELEMGVVRCLPDHGQESGATCEEWTNVFLLVDEDSAAMRRALCCMETTSSGGLPADDRFLPVEWTPIDGQGMCIGGTMTAVFAFDCKEC